MSSQVENNSMVAGKNYSIIFCRLMEDVAASWDLKWSFSENVSLLPYLSSVFVKGCIETMDSPSIAADPWMLDVSWVRNELLTTETTIKMKGLKLNFENNNFLSKQWILILTFCSWGSNPNITSGELGSSDSRGKNKANHFPTTTVIFIFGACTIHRARQQSVVFVSSKVR